MFWCHGTIKSGDLRNVFQFFDDLDLLEDANMTEKIDIGYATTRKVFDIRQLKGEFWNKVRSEAPVRPEAKDVFEINAGSSDRIADKVLSEKKRVQGTTVQDVFEDAASFRGTLNEVSQVQIVCPSLLYFYKFQLIFFLK